ncbi:hypothetical protein [Sphingomonas bacterium]|uniref:NMCC_0638 family (lipo)protein n=1 Tax=Sphingomonas bacterium TaxID=1895847 RepID=UPI001575F339|nr:hypothetical protein [Sphingomonas bacterium]
MPMLTFAALLAAQMAPAPDPVEQRMVALYDEVCLQAFPIDAAVDKAMAARGATPLTPAQVKVTLVDDPGRGWSVKDGDEEMLVFLELPPFHACSVRRFMVAGFADLSAYHAVADPFEKAHSDFTAINPYDADRGEIHVHAIGERRDLPGGGEESLFVFDQHITDPAKRAAGSTRVNMRFVHQIRTSQ